jgi:hypothetical protein
LEQKCPVTANLWLRNILNTIVVEYGMWTHIIHHNLAQEHVLEHGNGFGITESAELLKRLKEVAECCLVVLFISSQCPTLAVNLEGT